MTESEMQSEPKHQRLPPAGGAGKSGAGEGPVSAVFELWTTRLLLLYFGLRLVFFALSLAPFVPPDEVTHAGVCKVFSTVFLLPENGPGTYQYGLVTNIPWLYYWSMGKLLHLNVFGLSDLVFLRLLNIPLAFATVSFGIRLLRLVTDDRLTRLLLLVLLTNTAMFSLLSASVSYDNLNNLLAVMATYYALAFYRQRTGSLLAVALLCQLAGCLTKTTMIPLAALLDMLLAAWILSRWRQSGAMLRGYLTSRGRALWQVPLILLLLGLNLQLYGGNYLRFGTFAANMSKVLTPEIAMKDRIGARENIFSLYESGKISYMDALLLAGEMTHPGDKSDTFFLLMNYQGLRANPKLWMGPLEYTGVWLREMSSTTFGIKAHLPMYKATRYLVPVYLVLALALAGFMARWRPKDAGWLPGALALLAASYAGILLVQVNYPAYTYYGTPGITLQGRYLFPVLVPIYLLVCRYLLELSRAERPRVVLALGAALLFIAYDFPWFLAHAGAQWYSWLPQ
jgi:hypothetical protein